MCGPEIVWQGDSSRRTTGSAAVPPPRRPAGRLEWLPHPGFPGSGSSFSCDSGKGGGATGSVFPQFGDGHSANLRSRAYGPSGDGLRSTFGLRAFRCRHRIDRSPPAWTVRQPHGTVAARMDRFAAEQSAAGLPRPHSGQGIPPPTIIRFPLRVE
ncbi:hypothetical protein Sm713_27040 [Streptomyces sp. TS71-3]|nr:hypothetical protein Sm713_27040 [Streptomyces sp. TS71-3]